MSVLSIVDASNLERNLFLVSQVLSLGLPTVVALNMVDLARDRQIEIDIDALVEATWRAGGRGAGQSPRRHRAACNRRLPKSANGSDVQRENPFPPAFQQHTTRIRRVAQRKVAAAGAAVSRRAAAAGWRRLFGRRAAERHRDGRLAEVARCPRIAGRGRLAGAGGRSDGPLRLGRPRARRRVAPAERSSADDDRPHRRRADAQDLGHAHFRRGDGAVVFVDLRAGRAGDGFDRRRDRLARRVS